MIFVSDASPIISLSAVGQLDLLERLYGRVLIPEAVYQEILRGGPEQPGSAEIQKRAWLQALPVKDQILSRALEGELDRGEAEAIVLAVEQHADLLLMDERRGRLAAMRLGLKVVGTLGLLIEAKQKGLLFAVTPILNDLVGKAGFRVSTELYRQVIEVAGEQT